MSVACKFLIALASVSSVLGAGSAVDANFDYVIIGGGTAGLVVAERLTEDPSVTVAVIEAGVYHVNDPLVDTPGAFEQAVGNPDYDWNFVTVPQPGLNNATATQPRGKMLGGSSGLNYMIWTRGSAAEYNAWEELGAAGWNWNSLLPYFKKNEAVDAPPPSPSGIFPGACNESAAVFDEYHGRSGPIQVSYTQTYSNITNPYVEALNNLGTPTNTDPYIGDATGVYNTEVCIDRVKDVGQRSYSANTYYNMSSGRPNLHVYLTTLATKVELAQDAQTNSFRASGVQVVALNSSTGVTGVINAKKEVILSAGTLQTPQLLELSGIGNKTILESAGIDTQIDLPSVGENLQDHQNIISFFSIVGEFPSLDELKNNATFAAEQEQLYAEKHTGLLAEVFSVLAFVPLGTLAQNATRNSIIQDAWALTEAPGLSPLTKKQYQIQTKWLEQNEIAQAEIEMIPGGGAPPNETYITIVADLTHPWARGSVHIGSNDPTEMPLIDPNYLGNPVDLQIALQGVKFAREIANTEPLARHIVAPVSPPASVQSDADFTAYVRSILATEYHPIGTAAMLPESMGGVVDPKTLIVYGTENLRVVDASVMPLQVGAHIQSTVYAIAERASDFIKKARD